MPIDLKEDVITALLERVKRILWELGHLTPLAFVATFLPVLGSTLLIAFLVPVGNWLKAESFAGMAVYAAGVVVFCGLSLLPTNVIGIVGGFAFGFFPGIVVLIAGILGAAFLSFLVYRRIGSRRFAAVIEKHPRSAAVYHALLRESPARTLSIIFLLRLSVVMPFSFTNFLMASARVPTYAYLIGTFFGMLPRSAAVVFVGSGLSELDLQDRGDVIFLAFGVAATIAAMVVITVISRRALDKMTTEKSSAKTEVQTT